MPFTELTRPVQIKLYQFHRTFADDFSRPVDKFIRQMVFGILKSGSVQLNRIARDLHERIPLKKVTQRLGAHLEKAGLWLNVAMATLRAQAPSLRRCRFVIFDISDISKSYVQKMEGLAGVRDGSSGEIGLGYWLCNVTAVDETGTVIVPVYSELFSHTAEVTSENQKILDAVHRVMPLCGPEAISVLDRGGDRGVLLRAYLKDDRQFIARQNATRYLFYRGHKCSFAFLTRMTTLRQRCTVKRTHKNKVHTLTYDCGAIRVRLTATGKPLWLVVMKARNRGYCWLLCHFKYCCSAKAAVELAVRGYGLRWKIEEVHRQIKGDYQLEAIRLQRYEALKTMNALLWMAVSFLYTRLESLALRIIYHPELGLVNRKGLGAMLRFIYYKLAAAVKKILAVSRLYDKIAFPRADRQLLLPIFLPLSNGT